jgi:soluble lytic murein transglycosylase
MNFRILPCLLLLCAALVRADEPVAERSRFRAAYDAALAGRHDSAARAARGLEHYPLHAYIEYLALRQRLPSLPVAQVEAFLKKEQDTYLGDRLRGDWLRTLGQHHQWQLLVRFAVPTRDPILGCLALRARMETGQLTAVTPDVEALWLVGNSQSPACDPAFEHLRQRGLLSSRLALRRAWLALRENRPKLASFLLRRFAAGGSRGVDATVQKVAAKPADALQLAGLRTDSRLTRAILGYALVTLASQDPGRAQGLWRQARSRYRFADDEAAVILRAIALGAGTRQHPERRAMLANVPAGGVDASIERMRIREALQARDWVRLANWTAEPAVAPGNTLRWRYWHARALLEQGNSEAAAEAFGTLSRERDYYGFLASDRLGREYSLQNRPVAPTPEEYARVGSDRNLLRTREFYRLGLRPQANQEWQWLLANRPRRDVEIAAHFAGEWGWHDRAIIALGAAQSYDDLGLRFPLLFEDTVRATAKRRDMPPALVYSIVRGESAFVVDAKSVAGALGLMQLLPGTGEETARHLGVPWRNANDLLNPARNIDLGAAYLRRVMRQFGGSFPLAAAAYNAGPGRVKSWLPRLGCVPPDVWVELIPFVETEGYVRRALFYAAIYEHRMGEPMTSLSSRLANLARTTPAGGGC